MDYVNFKLDIDADGIALTTWVRPVAHERVDLKTIEGSP